MKKTVLVVLSLLLCVGLTAFAGGQGEKAAGKAEGVAVGANESPMLAEMVAAGELPPLEDRLPVDVQVVQPVGEVGKFGGTLRTVDISGVEIAGINKHGMFALAQDFEQGTHNWYEGIAQEKYEPDIANGGTFNDDFTKFTMYLREGMKWSDGEPVTSEDLMFWWEDIVNNEDIVANVPTVWRPGGTPMAVTAVDDYTVEFEFAVPYRFFQFYMTELAVRQMPLRPRHYLEEYHIDYNPDATDLAKDAGFDEWYELFGERGGEVEPAFHENADLPVLFPWKTIEYDPDIWVGERNPYYWRVDTAGNQLPYIDRVLCDISTNREVLTAKVVAGQVDYSAVVIPFSDIPLMKDSEDKGNFITHLWDVPMGTMPSINVNQTYPEEEDAVLREIFKDDRFRQALSLAIDREEANKVAYFGLSYPTQLTVLPGSRWEEERFRTAYADYDPSRANQLLDDMGLEWDNNNEWRVRPDGKTMSIVVETIDVGAIRGYSKILPLLKEYWEAVGVKTTLKTLEPALWGSRLGANQLQVTLWGVDSFNDLTFQILGPWLVPGTSYGGSTWHAMGWQQWATSDGEEGEEPPADVKRMMDLWEQMRATTDQDEITRLGKEIFALQAEHIYIIGVVGSVRQALVVSNDLGNFPPNGVWANPTSLAGYAWAFQWYFK